jgi:hypothetical protein
VDIVQKRKNYLERVRRLGGSEQVSENENLTPPVFVIRENTVSVTGGFVIQPKSPSRRHFRRLRKPANLWPHAGKLAEEIARSGLSAANRSFGRDEAGELYVVGYEGTIYKIRLGLDDH